MPCAVAVEPPAAVLVVGIGVVLVGIRVAMESAEIAIAAPIVIVIPVPSIQLGLRQLLAERADDRVADELKSDLPAHGAGEVRETGT